MHPSSPSYLTLAGKWRFLLDPSKEGLSKEFFMSDLTDSIMLPGTTDENRKGVYNRECALNHLTRIYPFKGFAWYQRDIELDGEISRKQLRLFLERTKISYFWLNDRYMGSRDTLCTPHIYDFPLGLTPGSYRLTILVDNENLPPIGDPHQISEHTQTNWNGIIGRIELQAFDAVFIQDVQIYPDVEKKKASVSISVRNNTGERVKAAFTISAGSFNSGRFHEPPAVTFHSDILCGDSTVSYDFHLGEDLQLWDEYSPAMYRLLVALQAESARKTYSDRREQTFGMRNFTTAGPRLYVNGRRVFLRGTHDACVFPLTGYSPMDVNDWIKVFETAKAYGLNHYRFHSWCPPEAAFAAADITGFYLQPELPNWASFNEPGSKNYSREHEEYLRLEGHRILTAYGNHPSFVLFSLGNELFGSVEIMEDIVKEFRSADRRHLFAQGSNNFYSEPALARGDDFWLTMRTNNNSPVRGSFAYANLPLGHIQSKNPPSTMFDYTESIRDVNIPVIGHETGQYQSFPDFNEIPEYTGVLRARNLEAFRKRLQDKCMLHQAEAFLKASGKLASICYREDIETALRTPDFGGFQLLDIKDFPGQGTALVGILNAFMKSKGFIEPEEWREFCSDAVLLARMPKYTYFSDERLKVVMEIAYYGKSDLPDAVPEWRLVNSKSETLANGEFSKVCIKQGEVTSLGIIDIPENLIDKPEKLTLVLKIKNLAISNRYPLWIYPRDENTGSGGDIKIFPEINTEAKELLKDGCSIFLMPGKISPANSVRGMFASDFWCYPMFRDICEKRGLEPSPGTLGILCDPLHPAFNSFPTEYHSNWQWWAITINSNPVILDDMPMIKPIVQVIDNFERNHRLGLLFEAKVGNGKLLFLASNLHGCMDRPEVTQLIRSLTKYMRSDFFNPDAVLSMAELEQILDGGIGNETEKT